MCPSALAASSSSQVLGTFARVLLRSGPESSTRAAATYTDLACLCQAGDWLYADGDGILVSAEKLKVS